MIAKVVTVYGRGIMVNKPAEKLVLIVMIVCAFEPHNSFLPQYRLLTMTNFFQIAVYSYFINSSSNLNATSMTLHNIRVQVHHNATVMQ